MLDRAANTEKSGFPSPEVCRRARLSRDARFDGRFFVAVVSTGIYCRPICPARTPREANVRYHPSAASAHEAGFRACLRCRPEAARSVPEWTLASDTVLRGLRMIEAGYLNEHSTTALAERLQVSERHLARLFRQELGAAPKNIARLSRANIARSLLLGSELPHAQVAFHAGYGSVSRFNAELRSLFGRAPGALRKGGKAQGGTHIELTLPVRGPYNFDWVFRYLHGRALIGIEQISGEPGSWVYRRKVAGQAPDQYWVTVSQVDGALRVQLPLLDEYPLHDLVQRVRRVFDLAADGNAIHDFLCQQPDLADVVARAPGLRVPGAWDGFEIAVRAVLGQQVSVARGTNLANEMISRYGQGMFPTAAQLMHQDVAELGMPGRRGRAISEMARLVHIGEVCVDECQLFDELQERLQDIDGIGPWTANYVRMRAARDPDAFPDNDWVVLKELGGTAAQARRTSQAWRPWRAYALMYLWFSAGEKRAERAQLREQAKRSKAVKAS